jgi:hypothetical protein
MTSPFANMRRLHERGPRSGGLSVDEGGGVLGPDCLLVQRTPRGYLPMEATDIAVLRKFVFDGDARLDRLPMVLAAIARALDAKDLVKAQLLALEIPMDALDERRLTQLALVRRRCGRSSIPTRRATTAVDGRPAIKHRRVGKMRRV